MYNAIKRCTVRFTPQYNTVIIPRSGRASQPKSNRNVGTYPRYTPRFMGNCNSLKIYLLRTFFSYNPPKSGTTPVRFTPVHGEIPSSQSKSTEKKSKCRCIHVSGIPFQGKNGSNFFKNVHLYFLVRVKINNVSPSSLPCFFGGRSMVPAIDRLHYYIHLDK